MTLRSTSINLGNPGAIGGSTPGAITGTTITANTKFLTANGSSAAPTYSFSSATGYGVFFNSSSGLVISHASADVAGSRTLSWTLPSNVSLSWTSGSITDPQDVLLVRDAANTLAQRNGANAQIRNSYNTFTNSTNYERLTEVWSSNVCYHKTEAAGTGTLRQYIPVTNGVAVASLPSAATAGVGARSFVTDANATTFASVVAGGGANKVPVYSDGTNWLIG